MVIPGPSYNIRFGNNLFGAKMPKYQRLNTVDFIEIGELYSQALMGYRLGYLISSDLYLPRSCAPGEIQEYLSTSQAFWTCPTTYSCHPSLFTDFLLLHRSSNVFFLLFFQSFCSHAEATMKFSSWPFAWDPRILLPFLWAPYIIFPGLFRLHKQPIWQFCTTGSNGRYKDCIAFAVFCNSQATMVITGLEEPPSGHSHNLLKY